MDLGSAAPIITYTNGLIISALLLTIFLLLRMRMPEQCGECANVKKRPGITDYEMYCELECMYNPPFRGSAMNSLFESAERRNKKRRNDEGERRQKQIDHDKLLELLKGGDNRQAVRRTIARRKSV